ncbi:lipopolysaccharide biosynthesis protein [Shewanella woodyi]|uniref:lipopolysaccharide biosynthesis protein n=1 Tax=Shewanella woodyi TaxID=60961 RepID=UPI003748F96C
MQVTSIERVKQAFIAGIWATLVSITLGFGFKIWLAQWMVKEDLALYHTVVDIISLSLILMTGFRSSMVVSYSQTQNDKDITNLFRYSLIAVVLLTWGIVLPYIKHQLHIDVEYFHLVGIILGMGFKVYFTNQIAMYRMYEISNRVTWLEPLGQIFTFLTCFYLLGQTPISSLFFSLMLSSTTVAVYMFFNRRKQIATTPIGPVNMDANLRNFMKKSFTASLEAGASILMIYITVLLTIGHFSIDELGDFQVVVRPIIAYLTLLFVFPIYRFVFPELAVCVRNQDWQQIKQIKHWVYKMSLIISSLFFISMLLFSHEIVALVFPEQYVKSAPVLMHFSMFFLFMMLNAYQLAFIKAHGLFTQSLLIRGSGIVALIASYYIYSQITDNVVAVILALGTGYLLMFLISGQVEKHILKQDKLTQSVN